MRPRPRSCNPCIAAHARVQAQNKVTTAITGIDSEQCYNIGLSAPLTDKEAETMTWCVHPPRSTKPMPWEGRKHSAICVCLDLLP